MSRYSLWQRISAFALLTLLGWSGWAAESTIPATAEPTASGLLELSAPAVSDAPSEAFDWSRWSNIMVQDGGRMKPLDTLANEFVIGVTGRNYLKPTYFRTISSLEVKDWSKLADRLLEGEKAKPETPIGYLYSLLPASIRTKLHSQSVAVNHLEKERQDLVREIESLKRLFFERENLEFTSMEELRAAGANEPEVQAFFAKFDPLEEKREAAFLLRAELLIALNNIIHEVELDRGPWQNRPDLPQVALDLLQKSQATPLSPVARAYLNHALVCFTLQEALELKPLQQPAAGQIYISERKYSAIELYVRWMLTWQGWDRLEELKDATTDESKQSTIVWKLHENDAWDALPMLDARFLPIRTLAKPETNTSLSIRSVTTPDMLGMINQLEQKRKQDIELHEKEKKVGEILRIFINFGHQRAGFNLVVGPIQLDHEQAVQSAQAAGPDHSGIASAAESKPWLPLATLIANGPKLERPEYQYDPALLDKLRAGFFQAREGLLQDDPKKFNTGSDTFTSALLALQEPTELYTQNLQNLQWEVHYNKTNPFYWAALFAFSSAVVMAVTASLQQSIPFNLGFFTLLGSLGVMVYGMVLRVLISGRPPVTNMYETIVWASFIMTALSIVLYWVYYHRIIPTLTAVVLGMSMTLANIMPIEMGASIDPLQPVLRSNFWLIIHVLTIVASYGAFMLSWAIANVALGYYILGWANSHNIKPLANYCYRAMQVGVLLLAVGTGLGAWWAADSWGRWWGWDPKEVWALIALIGYLMILHGRFVGLKPFGMLIGCVFAFDLVVMAWYGVNFVLGAGLHAYAFGSGGLHYVIGAVLLNAAFVAVAVQAHWLRKLNGTAALETEPTGVTDNEAAGASIQLASAEQL